LILLVSEINIDREDAMDFVERMKKVLSQGLDTTKDAIEVAADKAKELGERGVLHFEIGQLEREAGKKFSLLGNVVYRILAEEGKSSVSGTRAEVKNLLVEIGDLKTRIEAKENDLKKLGTG
jgi:hypothetical protein